MSLTKRRMTVNIEGIHTRRFTPFHTHMTVFNSFLPTTVHTHPLTHDGLGRAALVRRFKTRLKPSHKARCGHGANHRAILNYCTLTTCSLLPSATHGSRAVATTMVALHRILAHVRVLLLCVLCATMTSLAHLKTRTCTVQCTSCTLL
jgi:hypothetical protein